MIKSQQEISANQNEGRRRAAIRIKQKRKYDSQRWTIDGARRSSCSRVINRPSMKSLGGLHSKPWNDRFMLNNPEKSHSVGTRRNEGPLLLSSTLQENENNWKYKPAKALDSKIGQLVSTAIQDSSAHMTAISNPEVRHFSERADGELVSNFSRYEITPTTPLIVSKRNASVSPFDMTRLQAVLNARDSEDDEIDYEEDHRVPSIILRRTFPRPTSSHANIKLEELIYTAHVEEKIARRELLSSRDESQSHIFSVAEKLNKVTPVEIARDREEKIHDFAWRSKTAASKQMRDIIKSDLDGRLQYHKIINNLADATLDHCLANIASELETIVRESSETICRNL